MPICRGLAALSFSPSSCQIEEVCLFTDWQRSSLACGRSLGGLPAALALFCPSAGVQQKAPWAHSVAHGGRQWALGAVGPNMDVCSYWCKAACLLACLPPGRVSRGMSVPMEDHLAPRSAFLNYNERGHWNAAVDIQQSVRCGFYTDPNRDSQRKTTSQLKKCSWWRHG